MPIITFSSDEVDATATTTYMNVLVWQQLGAARQLHQAFFCMGTCLPTDSLCMMQSITVRQLASAAEGGIASSSNRPAVQLGLASAAATTRQHAVDDLHSLVIRMTFGRCYLYCAELAIQWSVAIWNSGAIGQQPALLKHCAA